VFEKQTPTPRKQVTATI